MTREEFDRHPWKSCTKVQTMQGGESAILCVDFVTRMVQASEEDGHIFWIVCEDVVIIDNDTQQDICSD